MIELGETCRDVVTDFTGTAIGRAEYLYEETQVLVSAKSRQSPVDSRWLSERRLERVDPSAPGFA